MILFVLVPKKVLMRIQNAIPVGLVSYHSPPPSGIPISTLSSLPSGSGTGPTERIAPQQNRRVRERG